MNLLRAIFFGLVQVIELPINALIELWRMRGRGRGLLMGLPSLFVFGLTLLAIGWAKYGSNEGLIRTYWQSQLALRESLDDVSRKMTVGAPSESQLGDARQAGTSSDSGPQPKTPKLNDGIPSEVVRLVQREMRLPRADVERNERGARAMIQVLLDDAGQIAQAEVTQPSDWPEWDRVVLQAVTRTQWPKMFPVSVKLPSPMSLVFDLWDTEQAKLRERMAIGLKKLIDLDSGNQNYRFELAILSVETGDMERAQTLMDQIASTDKPGLCKAHLWQARRIWDDETSKEPLNSRRQRCRQHLELALKSEPNNIQANEGMGELYFSMGNIAEAEKYYRNVWEQQLSSTFRLVAIYSMQRDQVKFNDILSKTKLRLKSLAAANPNEDVYVLDIERVNLLQGKVQEAIDTLNEHMTESRRAVFESRLARIYAGWAKSEAGQNNGKFTRETFEKIKMSLRYDPNLTEALWMLTLIGTEDSELSNEALALYDPVKNRETAPGEVLREYANYLLKQKRSAEALDWLELAYQRTPTDPIVANNLAFLLLSGAQTDPERALRLANQAIDQAPNLADPKVRGSLYDTKAAALIALTRYAEAIPYLEAALRDRPADKKILVSLRDSYAATGQRQFAERYQRRLDELDAAPAPQQ